MREKRRVFARIAVSGRGLVSAMAEYLWLFIIFSVMGLVIETVYHVIVFHELESRVGLLETRPRRTLRTA